MESIVNVREIERRDIAAICDYWLNSNEAYMKNMGVDVSRIPPREVWVNMLEEQLSSAYADKNSFCLIWKLNGEAIGHSNINKIKFGEEAFMHLHLWKEASRGKGLGTQLVKMSLPFYFRIFQLKTLYCEPYAHNPAPNKTLTQTGFTFLKTYRGIPGWLNFEQEVNLWVLQANDCQWLRD